MSAQALSSLDLNGYQLIDAVLQGIKFAEAPATPQPGHFYLLNGVLHYRDANNLELPVTDSTVPGLQVQGPLSKVVSGNSATLSIAEATATDSGVMPAAQYALLAGATTASTSDTLVLRDGTGGISASTLSANELSVTAVRGLSAVPAGGDYAVSRSFVESLLADAVNAAVRGLDAKGSVRVALMSDTPLTSVPGTYDGIAIATGESILLLNQTNPAENGAYTVTATGLVRRVDSDSVANLTPGAFYRVEEGSNAGNAFTLVTPAGFTLNTDPLSFLNVSGINAIIAGDGLTRLGETFHVKGVEGRIVVTPDGVDISPLYYGQTSIDTVGSITTGTWNAGIIQIERGGTGANTLVDARKYLGIPSSNKFLLGDGVASQFTIQHGFNTLDLLDLNVQGYYQNKQLVGVDFDIIDANTIRINAALDNGTTPIGVDTLRIRIDAVDRTS